jgi:hypothetical protein
MSPPCNRHTVSPTGAEVTRRLLRTHLGFGMPARARRPDCFKSLNHKRKPVTLIVSLPPLKSAEGKALRLCEPESDNNW